VPSKTLDSALDRLEELKRRFGPDEGLRAARALAQLGGRRFRDAASLIRFHELLLFMRAYPHNPKILRMTEKLLASFHGRVRLLQAAEAEDLYALTEPEVSGIAGTSIRAIWSYDIVRQLARRHPSQVEIDWEDYEGEALLVAVLKDFLPLFEDGAYAEYPIPYLTWLRAARTRGEGDLRWLLRHFEKHPISEQDKATLYDALKLLIHWQLDNSEATRTRMRRRTSRVFYHDGPLIGRADVLLARELEGPSLPLEKLSGAEGRRLLSLGRDTMTVRWRELHGYTYGDPQQVVRAEAGRGVEFFIWGVPRPNRLPMFGYHAVAIFKNGVPAGYAESLSLCERTECGLNLFYTFRDGESAWIYARLLHLFRQYLGVTVFSIDPYQLGFNNAEGIESGSFWFYRKLGFRPVRPELASMVAKEERKLATHQGYRTPARILRQLAAGHLLYESPTTEHSGDWDNFHIRNLGLAVQRRTATRFGGDAKKMQQNAVASSARALGIRMANWNEFERRAFSDLSLVLVMIPDLARWSKDETRAIARIVRAKASADETHYVRLLQSHPRLREWIVKIGSRKIG
jgi:hypothetical protein